MDTFEYQLYIEFTYENNQFINEIRDELISNYRDIDVVINNNKMKVILNDNFKKRIQNDLNSEFIEAKNQVKKIANFLPPNFSKPLPKINFKSGSSKGGAFEIIKIFLKILGGLYRIFPKTRTHKNNTIRLPEQIYAPHFRPKIR